MQARKLLAQNIRALAKSRAIKLNHLADRAGVSRAMLYRILAGTSAATTDWIEAIAKALDVEPARLLDLVPVRIDTRAHVHTMVGKGTKPTMNTNSANKIPVSHRALLLRINRKLEASGRIVRKLKPDSRSFAEFGPYWMLENNTVVDGKINLEKLAKKLDAIAAWEVLADEETKR